MRQGRSWCGPACGLLVVLGLGALVLSARARGSPPAASQQVSAKPLQLGTQVSLPAVPATPVAEAGNKAQAASAGAGGTSIPRIAEATGSRSQSAEQAILRTEVVLDYAALLVLVVTILFAVVTAVLGIVSYRRFRGQAAEIRGFREEIAGFQVALKEQQNALSVSQRFLDSVWTHYADLLVGIVSELGNVLNPEDDSRVRGRIFEAEAALNLFHPRGEEVRAALRRLEMIGTEVSVASLTRLMKDESVPAEVRLQAKDVLLAIRVRLRSNGGRARAAGLGGGSGQAAVDGGQGRESIREEQHQQGKQEPILSERADARAPERGPGKKGDALLAFLLSVVIMKFLDFKRPS